MRNRVVVSNSTPIIALLGIGCLGVLEELYGKVIIPKAVHEEITIKDASVLDGFEWIDVRDIANIAAKDAFAATLHDGEVEVMLLAKEIGAELIIMDDGLARKHVKYLSLTVTGTVGVLLRAKHDGIINEIKPVLDDLIQQGFYISDDVLHEVLCLAGETIGYA
jgi:predicted nucleic acid-binding protein